MFSIIEPLTRPACVWYSANFEEIRIRCKAAFDHLTLTAPKVSFIVCMARDCQVFDNSQIHLTPAMAKTFITSLIEQSENFFLQMSDVGNDDEVAVIGGAVETGAQPVVRVRDDDG